MAEDRPQRVGGLNQLPTKEQVEKAQETEYKYLLRRYRIDQEDTLKYKGAIQSILNKQIEVIDSLYAVKDEVMIEVTVSKNYTNDTKDDNVFRELKKLLRQGDRIDKQIKIRRLHVTEMEREIQKQKKILHGLVIQTRHTTDYFIEQAANKHERRQIVLNNQLHLANVKFNEVIADNRKKREELEDLLKGRTSFNFSFMKMVKLLHHGKTIMLDLVEMTKVAYEHREEAQARVNMVGKHGSSNRETKAIMIADLTKQLDHNVLLKDFVSSKGQKRNMIELDLKMQKKKEARKKLKMELLEKYQSILEHIQSLSGEANINKVVKLICKNEADNFVRFAFANELEDKFLLAEEAVSLGQQSIDNSRGTESKWAKARNETLERLRKENDDRQAELTTAYEEMERNRQHVDDLLIGVEALFDLTEADKSALLAKLGENEIPNEHNVWQYLEIIEQFTTEVLTKVMFAEKEHRAEELPLKMKVIKHRKAPRRLITLDKIDPQHPCAICVETTELSQLDLDSVIPVALDVVKIAKKLDVEKLHPDFDKHLHSLSFCPLPRSKKIEAKARNTPKL